MKIEDAEALVEEARGIESRASFLRETIQRIHAEARATATGEDLDLAHAVTAATANLSLNSGNKYHVDFTEKLAKLIAYTRSLEVACGIRRREVRGEEPADGTAGG